MAKTFQVAMRPSYQGFSLSAPPPLFFFWGGGWEDKVVELCGGGSVIKGAYPF